MCSRSKNVPFLRAGTHALDIQVAGEAQGDESSLKQFVQHLNKGPSAASVNGVEQKNIEPKQGEKGFSQD